MELSAFRNLFGDLQQYVVDILNRDEILQKMGAVFCAENSMDLDYEVRNALDRQGLACVVMTPRAVYQGHNGIEQAFTCDQLTLQIVESPEVHRAWLKKEGLDYGTALDVAKAASDRLAGPQGGYFGKFTTKNIEEGRTSLFGTDYLVARVVFGCTVYETLSAVISGDLSGNWVEVPFVRVSELSDWIDDYLSAHPPSMEGYFPLNLTSGLSVEMGAGNNIEFWRGHAPGEQPVFRIDGEMTIAQYLSAQSLGVSQIGVGSDLSLSGILGFNNIYHATNAFGYEFLGSTISSFVDGKLAEIPLPDMEAYVKKDNPTSAYIKVLGVNADSGFKVVDVAGNPFIQTADDRRTEVYHLSSRIIEVGDTLKSDSQTYDFIRKNSGSVTLQQTLDGMMAEVQEDYATYSYLIQQNYAKQASLSNYLPLSGGTITGAVGMDVAGHLPVIMYGDKIVVDPDAAGRLEVNFTGGGTHDVAYADQTWAKTDPQLSAGTGRYNSFVGGGAFTAQDYEPGHIIGPGETLKSTRYAWDSLTYAQTTGGTTTSCVLTYPISGGVIATREYVDAGLGDVQSYLTAYADNAANWQYGRATAYTDQQVSSKADASSLSNYLPLSGGTMTGTLTGRVFVAEKNPDSSDPTLSCTIYGKDVIWCENGDFRQKFFIPVEPEGNFDKTLATREYVDAMVGDISALIHES